MKNFLYFNIMSPQKSVPVVKVLNVHNGKNNSQNVHKCTYSMCNMAFGKKSRLVQHERTHTGERPFKCSYEWCGKSYTRSFHLTRHNAISHEDKTTVEEYLSCEYCENMYSNKYSLDKHKKIHTSSGYNCPTCGKNFRKENQLNAHMYEHTGVKPHRCEHPGCDKSFLTTSKLNKHSEVHLPNRYKCYHTNCQMAFSAFLHYRKHLTTEHEKVCIECNEKFLSSRKLNVHLKTHGQKEIFRCCFDACDRYYFHEKNLKAHIRTSHDESFDGFKCKTCDRVLSSKQKLNEHNKVHQPNYERRSSSGQTSTKPRKPRKDKGVRKRSIYSVLSGYDDSEACKAERIKTVAQKMPITEDQSINSCADIIAQVTARIECAMHLKPQISA